MSVTFDTTTRAAYEAATTATAKAASVVSSLTGTISVKVYNASNTAVGDGTMASPWATSSFGTITLGEVTEFEVTTTGTPDAGWYIRFENSDASRWVRASFGLASSSQDFKWSLATWATGQTGTIGTATIICPGNSAPAFTVAPTSANIPSTGGTIQFTATDPDGGTVVYSLTTTRNGVTINASTGLVTVTAAAAGTSGNIVVQASDGILTTSATCAVNVAATTGALIAGDDWDTFPLGPLADGYSYPQFGGTIRHSLSSVGNGFGVNEPHASVCVSSPIYGSTGRAFQFYIPGSTVDGTGEWRCQHELSNFEGYPSTAIEGREVWAGFAIRLDSAFPYPSEGYPFFFGAHAAVGQTVDGSPWGIRFMRTGATQWRFNMEQAGTSSYGVDLGDYSADRGQWVRWVMHMKYSLIGQGWAKVWKNGVQVVNQVNISTMHPTATQTPFIKWGIYNDRMRLYSSLDERITLDAIRIAGAEGSLSLVDPASHL